MWKSSATQLHQTQETSPSPPRLSDLLKSADCCVAVLFIPLRVLFVCLFVDYYLKCVGEGSGRVGPGVGGLFVGLKGYSV